MTRVLSELLGAREPMFRQGLARLETASGHTSMDIRLSANIERATRQKLRQLGLDPQDTTGQELYAALQERVKQDDANITRWLEHNYGKTALHLSVARALGSLPIPKSCFSLKVAAGKRLLKKHVPKHTMKLLAYSSFDSMLRREPLLAVFAAAWLVEPISWQKNILESYKKLRAADFEIRQLHIVAPSTSRWDVLAASLIEAKKNNIVGLKEFGAIVLLPLPTNEPPAAAMTMLVLALHEINEVRAASTFLKYSQVRPRFGTFVRLVVSGEPALDVELLDGPMPWQVIQRYYARFEARFKPELFEPHIHKEDFSWLSIEKVLSFMEPQLSFWHHTTNLGMLHGHLPVSCNIIDVALSYCNKLPFEQRIVQYFRHSLWHEILMTYLNHENVERTVLESLESQAELEPELL